MRAAYARNGSKWIRRARRLAIYGRDKWRCVWCTRDVYPQGGDIDLHPGQDATLDHVRPREQGGSNKTENLVTSCMKCNRKRGTKPAAEFAVELAVQAYRDQDGEWPTMSTHVCVVFTRVLDAITRPLP